MYGFIHMIALFVMLGLVPLMIWKRQAVKRLAASERFMKTFLFTYMSIDLLYWIFIWAFQVEPRFERFPLHLCASLSLLMPILLLTKKSNAYRFLSYWSVCAGFISLVNPSFVYDAPWSFAFMHYLMRHYFLFLMPIFVLIGRGYNIYYKEFLKSLASLAFYSFFIFLLDWATGANYMHLGPNNPLEIPFLPKSFTAWPYSYPSFVAVGIVLLHFAYFSFSLVSKLDESYETSRIYTFSGKEYPKSREKSAV